MVAPGLRALDLGIGHAELQGSVVVHASRATLAKPRVVLGRDLPRLVQPPRHGHTGVVEVVGAGGRVPDCLCGPTQDLGQLAGGLHCQPHRRGGGSPLLRYSAPALFGAGFRHPAAPGPGSVALALASPHWFLFLGQPARRLLLRPADSDHDSRPGPLDGTGAEEFAAAVAGLPGRLPGQPQRPRRLRFSPPLRHPSQLTLPARRGMEAAVGSRGDPFSPVFSHRRPFCALRCGHVPGRPPPQATASDLHQPGALFAHPGHVAQEPSLHSALRHRTEPGVGSGSCGADLTPGTALVQAISEPTAAHAVATAAAPGRTGLGHLVASPLSAVQPRVPLSHQPRQLSRRGPERGRGQQAAGQGLHLLRMGRLRGPAHSGRLASLYRRPSRHGLRRQDLPSLHACPWPDARLGKDR